MHEPRSNKIFVYVGNRDTGKTSFMKNEIDGMPQPKTLVVDTFDNPVWRTMKTWNHPEWDSRIIPVIQPEEISRHQYGLARTYSADTDLMQHILAQDCSNSSVIVEDVARYFGSKLTKDQKMYLLNSKQKNVDFHLIFHFLADVPPQLVKLTNYFTIFKTGEKKYDKDKYHHPDFEAAFNLVEKSSDPHFNITLKFR